MIAKGMVTDVGDGTLPDTLDEVVGHAQSLSSKPVAGKEGVSADDFPAERARELEME